MKVPFRAYYCIIKDSFSLLPEGCGQKLVMGGTGKLSYQPIALQRYYSATKSNKTTIPTGDYRPTEVLQCNKVKKKKKKNTIPTGDYRPTKVLLCN